MTAYGYNNNDDTMVCIKGVLERIFLILADTCYVANKNIINVKDISNKYDEYDQINKIISTNKTLSTDFQKDWYLLHSEKGDLKKWSDDVSIDDRRKDLKEYMIQNFKKVNQEDIEGFIENEIINFADNIGYENNDNPNNQSGGRKRKTKKTKKNKKYKIKNKKTKKIKKSKKIRKINKLKKSKKNK